MARINILIDPLGDWTSAERAESISREIYHIMRPESIITNEGINRAFDVVVHPNGQAVLIANSEYVINVHPSKDISKLISLMANTPQEERAALSAYINNSSSIVFGYIIPQNVKTITNAKLISDGYFG